MKKRLIAIVMMVVMTVASAFAVTGCKPTDKTDDRSTVLNVLTFKAGYGTTYLDALKEAFEKAFPGNEINILTPKTDLHGSIVIQEIYSGSTVDVYIPGNMAAESAVAGQYTDKGDLIRDVTSSVFDKPAIKLDGTEESMTIKEKLSFFADVADRVISYNGKYYGVPMTIDGAGLAINLKVLEDAGYSEDEIPVTTNELYAIADDMMPNISLGEAPFIFSSQGNGYCAGVEHTWLAQYEGLDGYKQIMGFEDAEGNPLNCAKKDCDGSNCNGHAYDVFAKNGLLEVMSACFEMYDPSKQTKGGPQKDFKGVQADFVLGKAAFYGVSAWMYNEEYKNYNDEIKDVTWVRIPVISALGPKLDLCKAGHVEKTGECFATCDACDALLSKIVRLTDAGKTAAEIQAEVPAANMDDIEQIMTSRFVVKGSAGGMTAWINATVSEEKQLLGEKFLRFIASDDVAALVSKHTNTVNPFNRTAVSDSSMKWLQNSFSTFNDERTIFFESGVRGYRQKMGVVNLVPLYTNTMSYTFYNYQVTAYDRGQNYKQVAGRELYNKAAELAMYGGKLELPVRKDGKIVYVDFDMGAYNHAKTNIETGGWKIPD